MTCAAHAAAVCLLLCWLLTLQVLAAQRSSACSAAAMFWIKAVMSLWCRVLLQAVHTSGLVAESCHSIQRKGTRFKDLYVW